MRISKSCEKEADCKNSILVLVEFHEDRKSNFWTVYYTSLKEKKEWGDWGLSTCDKSKSYIASFLKLYACI